MYATYCRRLLRFLSFFSIASGTTCRGSSSLAVSFPARILTTKGLRHVRPGRIEMSSSAAAAAPGADSTPQQTSFATRFPTGWDNVVSPRMCQGLSDVLSRCIPSAGTVGEACAAARSHPRVSALVERMRADETVVDVRVFGSVGRLTENAELPR